MWVSVACGRRIRGITAKYGSGPWIWYRGPLGVERTRDAERPGTGHERRGCAEAVAAALAFLRPERASFVADVHVRVDGGSAMRPRKPGRPRAERGGRGKAPAIAAGLRGLQHQGSAVQRDTSHRTHAADPA